MDVSQALHSPLMDPMLEPFSKVARTVTYREPSVPFVSTLTGGVVSAEVIIAEMSDEEVEALIMRKLAPQGR